MFVELCINGMTGVPPLNHIQIDLSNDSLVKKDVTWVRSVISGILGSLVFDSHVEGLDKILNELRQRDTLSCSRTGM